MLVGFIHGVMNTDNMTISGETIDYGPCAFMDRYDPATVYSSIDHGGRYAYGNQPRIAQWNLTRLAETLLTLIADDPDAAVDPATEVLTRFPDRFRHHWDAGMRTKLGIADEQPDDGALFDDLLELLHANRSDYTGFFRDAARSLRGEPVDLDAFEPWLARWRGRVDPSTAPNAMDRVNPLFIPRNHLVEEALEAGTNGDVGPFHELLEVVTHPFDARPEWARFAQPAPDAFGRGYQTFCGT
jgi:uncharacterized protein YdiU (UPF0061 family)